MMNGKLHCNKLFYIVKLFYNYMKHLLIISIFFTSFLSYSQTFTGGSGDILNNVTIDIPLTVSSLSPTSIDTINFGLEQICLNLTHTWDADLTISIVAPDGTIIQLFSGIGSDGDGMQNTCLRWDVTNLISIGTAPFNGTYKPNGQMGAVNNGQDPNGIWYLRVKDGYDGDEGAVSDWSVTFGNTPAKYWQFKESDLPIMVINTNGQTIADDPKIIADMGLIYNGVGVRNHMTDIKNQYNGKIGIEIRGNYSASLPQLPYAFQLQDLLGNNVDLGLVDMPAEHDWLLIANYNDKSFSRNILPYEMFDSMGHYATKSRLIDVVLNGQYQGIYLLCEQIKRDSNRVDIAKLKPEDITGTELTGGYILKIDYWDNSNSWQLPYDTYQYPGFDVHMCYYSPKMIDLVPAQKTYINEFISDFETALYGLNWQDPIDGYRKYIDVSTFIDYFIINELTRNLDGFKKSRYFHKDKDHADGTLRKLKAGPVWDFDWSQKDFDGPNNSAGYMHNQFWGQDINAPGWYTRLLEDPSFQNQMKCRYENLRVTFLSETAIAAKLDSVALYLDESKDWHFTTWGNEAEQNATTSTTYAQEIAWMKNWYHNRLVWLDTNLPGTINGCSFAGDEELNLTEATFVSFPNPFNSYIQILVTVPIKGKCTIRLTDQTGRVVKVQDVDASEFTQNSYMLKDLESLNNGLYILEFETENQKLVKKIIK